MTGLTLAVTLPTGVLSQVKQTSNSTCKTIWLQKVDKCDVKSTESAFCSDSVCHLKWRLHGSHLLHASPLLCEYTVVYAAV